MRIIKCRPAALGTKIVLLGVLISICPTYGLGEDLYHIDRYTAYQSRVPAEERAPLDALIQINFPSEIKTIKKAIDHALGPSGYRLDWLASPDAERILSRLSLPEVHRELGLMDIRTAVQTLANDSWQIEVDDVNRVLIISPIVQAVDSADDPWETKMTLRPNPNLGSLDEPVTAHYSSISIRELINVLLPEGWRVSYEVTEAVLEQKVVSHTETTRRQALYELFKEIGLRAYFYPHEGIVVVLDPKPKPVEVGKPYYRPTGSTTQNEELKTITDNSRKIFEALKNIDNLNENTNPPK